MFSSSRRYHGQLVGYQALGVGSILAWGVGKSFHLPLVPVVPTSTITGITNGIPFSFVL